MLDCQECRINLLQWDLLNRYNLTRNQNQMTRCFAMIGRADLIALPTVIIVVLYPHFLLLLHDFLPSHKIWGFVIQLVRDKIVK